MDGRLQELNGKAEKLVTVVVPVYNVQKYLRNCLDSVVTQTYEPIEVILVDDGSTDQSGKICDEYADRDSRIRVFHTENKGVSAARNLGIEKAGGDYVVFVDADDGIHRQLLEIYTKMDDAQSVLLCEASSCMEDLQTEITNLPETKDYVIQQFGIFFADDQVNVPWNKLYQTEFLQKYAIRFPEDQNIGEDLLFNLDYLRHAPTWYRRIRIPMYYYREEREGSLSNRYRKNMFQIQQQLFEALKLFLEDMHVWNEENAGIYYSLYWDRLYMTARDSKKCHDKEFSAIRKSGIWNQVWNGCRQYQCCSWKRKIKKVMVDLWKWKKD